MHEKPLTSLLQSKTVDDLSTMALGFCYHTHSFSSLMNDDLRRSSTGFVWYVWLFLLYFYFFVLLYFFLSYFEHLPLRLTKNFVH
jgi:hypothetical protein